MEIRVREATATAAAPAPDVVPVIPGATASTITVYSTQQSPLDFRDHIVLIQPRLGRQWEVRAGMEPHHSSALFKFILIWSDLHCCIH